METTEMPDTITATEESCNNGDSRLTVYIFGAGASVSAGYPTAAKFAVELEQYLIRLSAKPSEHKVDRLKRTISSTLKHLEETGAETIDELVGILNDPPVVEDAKTATEALFLDIEHRLTPKRLRYYSNFITRACLSPGNAKVEDRLRSDVRVLTFNYDRTLEIAYALIEEQALGTTISPDSPVHQIMKEALQAQYNNLNTGFQYGHGIKVTPRSFAYLKLHGSVGLKAQDGDYGFQHKQYFPVGTTLDDDMLWNKDGGLQVPSLIVFPHEKHGVCSDGHEARAFEGYVAAVESAAVEAIRAAVEVHICGYSVCQPKWTRFAEIVKHAPIDCKFIVHDPCDIPFSRLKAVVCPRESFHVEEAFSQTW